MMVIGQPNHMETRIFLCNHKPSDSRVAVEYAVKDRKVFLIGVTFLKGNVIDINVVRACNKRAKQILLAG